MTTKHTPGPWVYESGMVWTEDGKPLLQAVRDDPGTQPSERDANARAASAVPELLDALKAIVWNGETNAILLVQARAAIAKAEGRTE